MEGEPPPEAPAWGGHLCAERDGAMGEKDRRALLGKAGLYSDHRVWFPLTGKAAQPHPLPHGTPTVHFLLPADGGHSSELRELRAQLSLQAAVGLVAAREGT